MKRVPPKPQPDASNMLAEFMQAVKELAARQKEIQALVQEAQRISDTTKRARQEILADTNYLRSIAEQMLALPIGPQGIAGSPGRDGRDGKDAAPVNYDILARMASDLIPPPRDGRDGRPGRDGVSPSVDEIVNALFASKRLTLDEIVDLRPHLDNLRRAVMRGGGDTVAAGSGVTITQNNGVKTISVSSGAGDMLAANNLSDLADAATARTNLGVDAAGTDNSTPVTVTDSAEIDFTLTGQDITASLKAGSIDVLKLDSGVQTSLGLADSALQNIVEDTTPQLGGNLDTQGNTILGGTSTTADLILQTTSGVGATGADMHFKVGNNGATEAMTILNSGNVGIGTTGPSGKLEVANGNAHVSNSSTNPASSGAVKGLSFGFDANLEHGWIQAVRNNGSEKRDLELQPIGGNVGIGTTTPTAYLHLKAGTASASTAPIKLTAGTVNTTPESGAIEFDGTNFYFTI